MKKSNKSKSKSKSKNKNKSNKIKAPSQSYSSELKSPIRPSLIEELLPPPEYVQYNQYEKMNFEAVYSVFDALYCAFHYDTNLPEGDVDNRFVALWTLFLLAAGFTEEEFWQEVDSHEHTCSECRKEQENAEKQKTTSQETNEEPKVEVIKPKMLPPGKQFN